MDTLKTRFIASAGEREFGGVNSRTQAPYYLARLQDNLVAPMSQQHVDEYARGSGGELDGKMRALRSSSAMTFNLLGNGPVELNGAHGLPADRYAVEFECQLPTLAGNPRPANLDARLESTNGDSVIYCEMKLAEWILNKAGGLREQYLEPEGYLVPTVAANVFCEVFASLCEGGNRAGGPDERYKIDRRDARSGHDRPSRPERLAPRLVRYDAFQMMKHLLAIYTEASRRAEAAEPLPKRVILLNCVWEMTHPEKLGRYEAKYRKLEAEEHAQYQEFSEAVKPLAQLFADIGIEFDLRYLTFTEMLDSLELKTDHRKALDRYIV